MWYKFAADAVVLIHSAFVVFVVIGGLLALKWHRIVLLHLPAVIWAVLLEFRGWICPLTPLEQDLRVSAGQAGYSGGFVEHYILPVLYPGDLDRAMQIEGGVIVILINLAVYGLLLWRFRQRF